MPFESRSFDSVRAEADICRLFGVATLDSFGAFSRAELSALGGLVAYLDHVGQGRMPFLAAPVRAGSSDHLAIDPATRESLEIVQTMSGQRAGSLLATIDRTVTGAGARMLAADVSARLWTGHRSRRGWRLLHGCMTMDRCVRTSAHVCAALLEIGRALGRVAIGRGSPRPRTAA